MAQVAVYGSQCCLAHYAGCDTDLCLLRHFDYILFSKKWKTEKWKLMAAVNIKLLTLKRYFINLIKLTQDGDGCACWKMWNFRQLGHWPELSWLTVIFGCDRNEIKNTCDELRMCHRRLTILNFFLNLWQWTNVAQPIPFWVTALSVEGFPGDSAEKKPPANAGDASLTPASGRSPREGHGNPLQDSCLENPMDRGAWWATVQGVINSRTQLSD